MGFGEPVPRPGPAGTAADANAAAAGADMVGRAASVVSVRGLRMRYGETDVLTGVDFDIAPGEVVCLLGPNGAGKTTTIEVLEGFRIRSAGEVSVLGEDPAHASEDWRARTGVVLQLAGPPAVDASPAAHPLGRLLRAVQRPRSSTSAQCRPAPGDGRTDGSGGPQDRGPVRR